MTSHKTYQKIAREIGDLVQEKNDAYGDSFGQSCRILEVLYPEGINPDQYRDALAITRVIDKLFRLANKKDAFGESPWRDIAGYALLGIANDENDCRRASNQRAAITAPAVVVAPPLEKSSAFNGAHRAVNLYSSIDPYELGDQ